MNHFINQFIFVYVNLRNVIHDINSAFLMKHGIES